MKLEDLEYYIENNIKLSEELNCGIFLNYDSFNLIFKNENVYEIQLSNKITILSGSSLSLKNNEMKIIILDKNNIIKNKNEFLLSKDEQIIKNINNYRQTDRQKK